jgi:CopG family transcriptional regulator, nickel-responsive regulator
MIYIGLNIHEWKMTIVSLSFPDKMMREMDELQETLGFTGRSELVRASIRMLLQDAREKRSLTGRVSAIVVVTHDQENEETVTKIKHSFDDIVRTHIHEKVPRINCVELFLLDGDAGKVASMVQAFQKSDEINSVKLVTV